MTPFIIQASGGIFLVICGWILKKYPPKKKNMFYGYRTGRAFKSKEAWDFAQNYSAKILNQSALFLLLISPVFLAIRLDPFPAIMISTTLVLMAPVGTIYYTEKALKKKFPTH